MTPPLSQQPLVLPQQTIRRVPLAAVLHGFRADAAPATCATQPHTGTQYGTANTRAVYAIESASETFVAAAEHPLRTHTPVYAVVNMAQSGTLHGRKPKPNPPNATVPP